MAHMFCYYKHKSGKWKNIYSYTLASLTPCIDKNIYFFVIYRANKYRKHIYKKHIFTTYLSNSYNLLLIPRGLSLYIYICIYTSKKVCI